MKKNIFILTLVILFNISLKANISKALYLAGDDVTKKVKDNSGKSITVSNTIFGDPVPGVVKHLLTYDQNNNLIFSTKEGNSANIPNTNIRLISEALYLAGDDVTKKVKDNSGKTITVDNTLLGDPVPGIGIDKHLLIYDQNNNLISSTKEGSSVNIPNNISRALYLAGNDVTKKVKDNIGKTITAGNVLFGDPVPNAVRNIVRWYYSNQGEATHSYKEKENLGIPKHLLIYDNNNNLISSTNEGEKVAIPS